MFSFIPTDDATNFAYDLGAEVEGEKQNSIWKLHTGKKKVSGKPVSIFVLENFSQETQTSVEKFTDRIQPAVKEIYPRIVECFSDTDPTIRDQAIKCMLYLTPKMNYEILYAMLKYFLHHYHKDQEAGIRRNIIVCICKISSYLHPNHRKNILISACHVALRDSSPSVRVAAIMFLSAKCHYFSIDDWPELIFFPLYEVEFSAMNQWKCSGSVDQWKFSAEKIVMDYAMTVLMDLKFKYKKFKEDPRLLAETEKELKSTMPSPIAVTWIPWNINLIESTAHTIKETIKLEDINNDIEHRGNEICEKWKSYLFGEFQKKSDEESQFSPDNCDWNTDILDTRNNRTLDECIPYRRRMSSTGKEIKLNGEMVSKKEI